MYWIEALADLIPQTLEDGSRVGSMLIAVDKQT